MEPVVYTPVSAAANLRRTAVIGGALGVVAIIVTSIIGHPLMGVFGAVGLALSAANNWLLQRSVLARARGEVGKGRFNGSVLMRLGGTTVIAIIVALLVHPDGLAIFIGLALFQAVMLIGAAVPVFRSLRPTA